MDQTSVKDLVSFLRKKYNLDQTTPRDDLISSLINQDRSPASDPTPAPASVGNIEDEAGLAAKSVTESEGTTMPVPAKDKTGERIKKSEIIPSVVGQNDYDLLKNRMSEYTSQNEESKKRIEDIIRQRADAFKPQVDLSPLMALSDSLFGSKIAKGYTPPQTKQDFLTEQAKLEALASKYNLTPEEAAKFIHSQFIPQNISYALGSTFQKNAATDASPNAGKHGLSEAQIAQKLESLSKRLQTTPEMRNGLMITKQYLDNPGKDIPGYGATGALPDVFLTQEGKEVRQAFKDLANMKIQMITGQAGSDTQAQRIMDSWGIGRLKSDKDLRTGMKKAIQDLQATQKQIYAGYLQPVRDAFKEQGGYGPDEFAAEFGALSNPPVDKKSGAQSKLEKLKAERAALGE